MISKSERPLFCPRCATENAMEPGFCRQCGQSLFGIQELLDGRIGEMRERLECAVKWIKAGNATLLAFISIAVLICFLGIVIGNPILSTVAMLNVIAGAVIGFPLALIGNVRLSRAKRPISPPPVSNRQPIQGTSEDRPALSQTTRLSRPINQGSVTDHTTIQLSPVLPVPPSERK